MTKHILIVDDSATMRKLVMRGLLKAGVVDAEFREAADGVEGLRAAAGRSFDLILSDVDMPNMNGLEFVAAVVEQVTPVPPIVMITTESDAAAVQEALQRGASGHLQKPFTPDRIQDVLGPFLD